MNTMKKKTKMLLSALAIGLALGIGGWLATEVLNGPTSSAHVSTEPAPAPAELAVYP